MKEKWDWYKIIMIFLFISLIVSIIIALNWKPNQTDESLEKVISLCRERELISAMNCLNFIVRFNFKYRLTDSNPETPVNITELFGKGGDCQDWTNFYRTAAESLGYSSVDVSVYVKDGYGHTFLIVYDETGYCRLDQTKIDCVEYE